jgi:hypothetical protein
MYCRVDVLRLPFERMEPSRKESVRHTRDSRFQNLKLVHSPDRDLLCEFIRPWQLPPRRIERALGVRHSVYLHLLLLSLHGYW